MSMRSWHVLALVSQTFFLFAYSIDEVFVPFEIKMVIYPTGVEPQVVIDIQTITPVLGDPKAFIVMPSIHLAYNSFPTTDQIIPITATYIPNAQVPYQYEARLIAPIMQQLNSVVTTNHFYQYQLVFLPPPQANVYWFDFMANSTKRAKSWLGGPFPVIISQSWASDMLFLPTYDSTSVTIYLRFPAAALQALPSSVYWAQFQWNMEPVGVITTPILNFQALQQGIFLGYQQQIESLLTFNNSPSFQATLESNLAYVNEQIAELQSYTGVT